MAKTDINTIKDWFKNLAKPTQEQFWAWLDSFWHKDEKIPAEQIEGIDEILSGIELPDVSSKLDKTGENIDESVRAALREKLGIGDIPSNVATIDEDDTEGSVYTKQQVDAKIPEDTNISNSDLTIEEGDVKALNVLGRLDIKGKLRVENVQFSTTTTSIVNSVDSNGHSLFYTDDAGDKQRVLTEDFEKFKAFLENLTDRQKVEVFTALGGVRVVKLDGTEAIPTNANTIYLKQIP